MIKLAILFVKLGTGFYFFLHNGENHEMWTSLPLPSTYCMYNVQKTSFKSAIHTLNQKLIVYFKIVELKFTLVNIDNGFVKLVCIAFSHPVGTEQLFMYLLLHVKMGHFIEY